MGMEKRIDIRPDGSLSGSVSDNKVVADIADHQGERQALAAQPPADGGQVINVHVHPGAGPGRYLWSRRGKPQTGTQQLPQELPKQIAAPEPPKADYAEQVRDTLSSLRDRDELPEMPAMPEADHITGERSFNLKDVLAAADEDAPGAVLEPTNTPPEMDDSERRAAGMQLIDAAVVQISRKLSDGQIRYEQALMVENEQVESMRNLSMEAGILGLEVKELAKRIIAERKTAERRTAFVHATRARAELDMKAATGEAITAIADGAVVAILDDDNMVDE